jgi:hypothetical protein
MEEVDYVNVPRTVPNDEHVAYVNVPASLVTESDSNEMPASDVAEIPATTPTKVTLAQEHTATSSKLFGKKLKITSGTEIVVVLDQKKADRFRISWPAQFQGHIVNGLDITEAVGERQQKFRELQSKYPSFDWVPYVADLPDFNASFDDMHDVLFADSYSDSVISRRMQAEKTRLFANGIVSKNDIEVFKFLCAFDASDKLQQGRAIIEAAQGCASKAQDIYDQIQAYEEKFANVAPLFNDLLEFPRELHLAKGYWARIQRISTLLKLVKFSDTMLHLTPDNLAKFETHLTKRAIQKIKTDLKLKFKSFVVMFDIDDTVLHLDSDLQNLGYGMTPEESDKVEAAIQRYNNDYPGLANLIDQTFPNWWQSVGSKFFPDHQDSALEKMRDYLRLCIKQAKEVGDSRIVFNHERKTIHSRMVGHIFPEFQKVLRVLDLLELPIAFTSKNPFIKLSRTERNLAGEQFEAKLKSSAPNLKIWYDFNSIGGSAVDKQSCLQDLYKKGIHGLYFDDSAEFFDPARTKLYLDPLKTGFAAAQVDKNIGATMTDVLQAVLVYSALWHDHKGSYDAFPEVSISPPPAVYHLISWP